MLSECYNSNYQMINIVSCSKIWNFEHATCLCQQNILCKIAKTHARLLSKTHANSKNKYLPIHTRIDRNHVQITPML